MIDVSLKRLPLRTALFAALYAAGAVAAGSRALSSWRGDRAALHAATRQLTEELRLIKEATTERPLLDSLRTRVQLQERRVFVATDDFAADDQVARTMQELARMAQVDLEHVLTRPGEPVSEHVSKIAVDISGSGDLEPMLRLIALIHGASTVTFTSMHIGSSQANAPPQPPMPETRAAKLSFRLMFEVFTAKPLSAS